MLLIKNAKLYTMGPDGILDGGDVLMDGGKVVRVGKGLSQGDCKVIDARGAYVTPGYVDAHCHVGMWENGLRDNDGDGNERTDPITPELRALDGLHPLDRSFEEAYQNGVITAAAGPGSANVLGGQFLAIKTWGRDLDSRIVKEPLAMKSAFGENPKRVYGSQNKMPQTRMASAALLRQTLIQAQEYMQKRELPEDKRPARSLRMEALVPVLKGEMILKMHAHRAEDILTAIRIAKEFGLKATIEHCTEGYMIADELRKSGVGVICGPLISERAKPELRNLTMAAPGILHKAGVKFALMTDHPVIPLMYLPVEAGLCVREGLEEYEALKAITINAAQVIGLEDRVGSLEPGKDADVVLFDGHPLDTRTHASLVVVNGEIVHERV
ncbi:MAG TPA: amidohydrolase [Candidatus Pullichristensenella excrementigallinarum]|uniref:Amidohydrolase n=1 Tax=Candidatus Pullichristensenella excrementigallinarum TaxID=2840907 RepID=A0A9D1LBE2_9FIRM|nr:amidohydrolase [Candidatus Pullichristensenella excrementigallinarum]